MEQCVMTTGTMRMPLSSALNLDSLAMVENFLIMHAHITYHNIQP